VWKEELAGSRGAKGNAEYYTERVIGSLDQLYDDQGGMRRPSVCGRRSWHIIERPKEH